MKHAPKFDDAISVIHECTGKNGVWAGATRYRYQCWTRDFLISLPEIYTYGKPSIAEKHLDGIVERQKESGELPILFADSTPKLFLRKVGEAIRKRRISFVLRKMIYPGIDRLSPGTRDVEPLFVATILQRFGLHRNPDAIYQAMDYALDRLDEHGLFLGADWRDMLEKDLEHRALLSNNAVLIHAVQTLALYHFNPNNDVHYQTLLSLLYRIMIESFDNYFWTGAYYRDHPDTDCFDTFGQSLAIQNGIVPPHRFTSIIEKYRSVAMPYGFRINDIFPQPRTHEEAKLVHRIQEQTNQYGVVWPFINGFAIITLMEIGAEDLAIQAWKSWNKLEGFYEWYDPETGKGFGDSRQLWSAALYLRVANLFNDKI